MVCYNEGGSGSFGHWPGWLGWGLSVSLGWRSSIEKILSSSPVKIQSEVLIKAVVG